MLDQRAVARHRRLVLALQLERDARVQHLGALVRAQHLVDARPEAAQV